MTERDERLAEERAPLVAPDNADGYDADSVTALNGHGGLDNGKQEAGLAESKSGWYMFMLTLSIGGLQVIWSVELSNGSPYLLSLGMSRSLLAFVWIAGPLTGTLVQPYIGLRSDNCRISWGKRKPFMIAGGAASIITLIALAWAKELIGGFLWLFGVDVASSGAKVAIIVLATILMYCVDISINTVQAGIRCFIVDNAPSHQQETANAWAGRLTGMGNILGYIFGYLDLPKFLPFFGDTQFKVLCVLASISLSGTLLASCLYIKERDPRLDGPPDVNDVGIITFFKQVLKSIRHLPSEIAKVCEVQVAAWVGWFPFLFYATTYVGQLYVNPVFEQNPGLSDHEINLAWEEATRIGTFALLIYAVISFIVNMTLPALVVPTYKKVIVSEPDNAPESRGPASRRLSLSSTQTESYINESEDKSGPSWSEKLQIPGFTLRRAWLLSHVLFAILTFSTIFISTYQAATAVIALVGICWALTLWAPFALISGEIARIEAERRIRRRPSETGVSSRRYSTSSLNSYEASERREDLENGIGAGDMKDPENDENLAQAGMILGLHNVAVSAPQILSSLVCSGIFKVTQKPRGQPGDDSVGWVLRFGGCAALVAAVLTARLAKGTRAVPVQS